MYLLDSSAWLVHLFGEHGVEQVRPLFADEETVVAISVLSLVEVYARLKAIGKASEWEKVLVDYRHLFTRIVPVETEIAEQAILLRANSPRCLPTVDALIAATAVSQNLTLVHRDPHFQEIPASMLKQQMLAAK